MKNTRVHASTALGAGSRVAFEIIPFGKGVNEK
jgi:hypothetical protein